MSGTVHLSGTFTATLAQSPSATDAATLSTATANAVSAGQAQFNVTGITYLITCDDGTVANVTQSVFDTYMAACTQIATPPSPAQPAPAQT
jgi:hypothetical protein